MKRLTEEKVLAGSLASRLRASCPTSTVPSWAKETTEGTVRLPSLSATMMGLPSTTTATALLVVPRSMPHIDAARVVTLMGARRPRARGRPEVCSPRRDGERSGSWRPCERRRRAERREDDGRGLDEDATVEALASIARGGPIAVRNSEAAVGAKK